MSGHCEDVCTPDTMVCALVHGSIREVRRGWQSPKSLIFMHFHGVFLGSQHEIWSKQHNGKLRLELDQCQEFAEDCSTNRTRQDGNHLKTYPVLFEGSRVGYDASCCCLRGW